MYMMYTGKLPGSNENKNEVTNTVENVIKENNNTATYNSIKGLYKGDIEDLGDGETEVRLNLCENGIFSYYYDGHTDCHLEGFYIIENNQVILNSVISCANDPSGDLMGGTIKFDIKENKSLELKENNTELKDNYKLKLYMIIYSSLDCCN